MRSAFSFSTAFPAYTSTAHSPAQSSDPPHSVSDRRARSMHTSRSTPYERLAGSLIAPASRLQVRRIV